MNRPRFEDYDAAMAGTNTGPSEAPGSKVGRTTRAPITLFAIPKAFHGHLAIIQRNAIKSWCRLAPAIDVILVGDDEGVAEIAAEFGLLHIPQVERNELGTPLINSAFDLARAASESPVLVYCNSDVILLKEFPAAIEQLMDSELDQFVAFGRRTDLKIEHDLDFDAPDSESRLRRWLAEEGRRSSVVCKEFFVFTRDLFQGLPRFAVGRGNWDSWMVARARDLDIPVVSFSERVPVIHQDHGYRQTSQLDRLNCYVFGREAQENQRLARGRNLIRGSSATWVLTEAGPRKKPFAGLNPDFWCDSSRFLTLVMDLLTNRR
jgi:hypothetical protein